MRTFRLFAAAAALVLFAAHSVAWAEEGEIPGVLKSSWETDPAPVGVYCSVNSVRLLAQSADDCTAAGGQTTHTLNIVAAPALP